MRSRILAFGLSAAVAITLVGCKDDPEDAPLVSSRASRGHENERDTTAFVNAYPSAVGTRLDDCQTCHRGGTFRTTAAKTLSKNACDHCHLVIHPSSELANPQPTGFDPLPAGYADTLNAYGAAYLAAGGADRGKADLTALDAADSDGDGFANGVEIADGKYPGDPSSKPGQVTAPQKAFTRPALQALARHAEFLLANSNKQQYDEYATYGGVRVRDLLVAAGVDLADPALTGVTVVAPDGYLKSIPIAKVVAAYPAGVFHAGLDVATLGATCGFVSYPSPLPAGLVDGGAIPGEQWLVLAYDRDGAALDTSNLDPTSGKINGEGPYRLVVPQSTPGWPDRGSQYSPTTCGDGRDYAAAFDHNAGDMVRGVIAVRVDPLPAGYEDFDAKNGGWAYVEDASVIVYGHGVAP